MRFPHTCRARRRKKHTFASLLHTTTTLIYTCHETPIHPRLLHTTVYTCYKRVNPPLPFSPPPPPATRGPNILPRLSYTTTSVTKYPMQSNLAHSRYLSRKTPSILPFQIPYKCHEKPHSSSPYSHLSISANERPIQPHPPQTLLYCNLSLEIPSIPTCLIRLHYTCHKGSHPFLTCLTPIRDP